MVNCISNAQSKLSLKYSWLLLFWCLVVIVLRNPSLIAHPRFWAEEGEVYFQYAIHHTYLESLFKTHLGYFSLFSNSASILGTLVPLKTAPAVTTFLALVVQLIPMLLVVFGTSAYWDNVSKKIIICVLILTIPEAEIWLNTINSQFYLALSTVILLCEPTHEYRASSRAMVIVLLLLAFFSGPVSCFIAPLYVLKAYHTRSNWDTKIGMVAFVCAIIQASICIYLIKYEPSEARFTNFDSSNFVKSYLADFLGIIKVVGFNDKKNVGLALLPYVAYIFWINSKTRNGLLIVMSFLLLTFLSLGSALNMSGSPRYGFVPTFILFVLIINEIFNSSKSWSKNLAAIITIVMFTINIIFYQQGIQNNSNCYNWKDEVQLWENDSNYKPRISPCTGAKTWEVVLTNN